MKREHILGVAAVAVLLVAPFFMPAYLLHLAILVLFWGMLSTSWALMGRFGMVSLGHGAFIAVGAYTTTLLWNVFGLTPFLSVPIAAVLSAGLAFLIFYPSCRQSLVGHYFALVTLAVGQISVLVIVALRDYTGGSLGVTLNPAAPGQSFYALQFSNKLVWYFIALAVWLVGLAAWGYFNHGIRRATLDAVATDEQAAAAMGVNVMAEKLTISIWSAALCAVGGGVLGQYLQYLNPEYVAGLGISLILVFSAVVGGMRSMLGPTVGTFVSLGFTELLRLTTGTSFVGLANSIYGFLLILIIIFMPGGIVGRMTRRTANPA
ncbi:branched-chain amino acid ABC transporter permease [Rhizobium sp. LjRoot30]|uniref:branched-chain amino acid ABC transporter permease n=1 Tax=Rhizobium sp. LjRoot30 TaxID=3342320 RepID=UPI003ECCB17B